ncbi:plasmid replicase [Acinetobacter baumannii]|uniref:Plasmid replicase n=2 Tax=Acinetobacter baumannii TaxID=470 RepID=A0A3F3MSL8_ACIBA|nr:replication initiation protein [Acinetobacter baumannii]MCE6086729.1 replication initiation protein [Acinetobacter baumannii]MCW1388449.1 replication initiation protein [Acinetobacter baumannii]PZM17671.1 plasmid replicase [Acinetobacter baumannii]
MLNKTQFSDDFYEKLPKKPYCSDDLGRGVIIRPKRTAIQKPYIQHNPPCLVSSLVFDIDRQDAYFAWSDANLPTPTWIAKNRQNGHAHIGYMLLAPVCTTHRAKQNVIQYLAKIEQAYSLALGADRGYTGLITKNPCHGTWENHTFGAQPYDLNYLADFVELQELKTDLKEVSGLGRNCMMFDTVRFWAYEAIRAFISGSPDSWYAEVLKVAINANGAFLEPLPYSEVKATAKSIARWVWRNHTEAHAKFIERQTVKGRKGGLSSDSSHGGKARSQQYSDMRQEALKLHIQGIKQKDIALQLNVSDRTIRTWIKKRKVQA